MAMTTINIRMDETLKKEMETLCQELGMTLTTAVTIFARKMVREQGIPFEVKTGIPYEKRNKVSQEGKEIIIWTDPLPEDE